MLLCSIAGKINDQMEEANIIPLESPSNKAFSFLEMLFLKKKTKAEPSAVAKNMIRKVYFSWKVLTK